METSLRYGDRTENERTGVTADMSVWVYDLLPPITGAAKEGKIKDDDPIRAIMEIYDVKSDKTIDKWPKSDFEPEYQELLAKLPNEDECPEERDERRLKAARAILASVAHLYKRRVL